MSKRAAWWIISIFMALTVGVVLVSLLPYVPYWILLVVGIVSGVSISVMTRRQRDL